ncbi:MAG: hypothetical protein LBI96_00585 [Odoribacteraceae bacterium]|nr:hypothetical protein [Odoribacteraceae bacterium]
MAFVVWASTGSATVVTAVVVVVASTGSATGAVVASTSSATGTIAAVAELVEAIGVCRRGE